MMDMYTSLLTTNASMHVVRIISITQEYAKDANHLAYHANSMQMIVNHVLLDFSSILARVPVFWNALLEHMLMQHLIVLLVLVVV